MGKLQKSALQVVGSDVRPDDNTIVGNGHPQNHWPIDLRVQSCVLFGPSLTPGQWCWVHSLLVRGRVWMKLMTTDEGGNG
jgi:hypothetical protein